MRNDSFSDGGTRGGVFSGVGVGGWVGFGYRRCLVGGLVWCVDCTSRDGEDQQGDKKKFFHVASKNILQSNAPQCEIIRQNHPRQEYIYSLQRTIPLQALGDFRPMRSLRPNRISPTGQDFSEHNCSLSRTGQVRLKSRCSIRCGLRKKPKFVIMLSSLLMRSTLSLFDL